VSGACIDGHMVAAWASLVGRAWTFRTGADGADVHAEIAGDALLPPSDRRALRQVRRSFARLHRHGVLPSCRRAPSVARRSGAGMLKRNEMLRVFDQPERPQRAQPTFPADHL